MHDPSFAVVEEEELAAVLRVALRQGGGTISRDTDLFMARIVAEHLAARIAAAGLCIVRPRPPDQWLLP